MHRTLELPGQLVGLALLVVAALWTLGWRRATDPEDRKLASFGGILALVGLVLLTGVAGTLRPPTYGVSMGAGCLALAALSIHWARQQRLLGMEQMVEALLITGVCGLIGARVVFLVESWDTHFTDRPPTMAAALVEPLAAGDTLALQTHDDAPFAITFQGDERDLTAVKARLEAQGGPHDLVVALRTAQHRGDAGIESTERGLLLRTGRRGPTAVLRVIGGTATRKLGLLPRSYTTGVEVPLSRVFDLRKGGLTYFGSVIGVLLSAAIYLRWRKVSYLRMLDLVAPALPLGLFFGRLGCLANGCCWGREAGERALYSVQFPPWSPAWTQFAAERLSCRFDLEMARAADAVSRGVPPELGPELTAGLGPLLQGTPPVHATQLYEGVTVLGIFFLALAYRRWLQRRVGQTFAVVVLLQAPVRFVVEHFRRDHEVFFPVLGYPLTESQIVALSMFALAVPAMVWLSLRGQPLSEVQAAPAPAAPASAAPASAAPEDPSPEPSAPEPSAG